MIRAKIEIESLEQYSAPLEGRRGMLRLDFNENTVGPSPRVIQAIRDLPAEAYATYPEYAGIAEAYAASIRVSTENVRPFNGVDAAIHAIFDVYGKKGSTFLTTAPTFGYYGPCALQHGMLQDEVLYEDDLSFPLETIKQRLAVKPALCFICNPNNPTGTMVDPGQILNLARLAPDSLIVVDELYSDFAQKSVLPEAPELENVVVLRSFSKSAGLAALRLGFAVGNSSVLDRLFRVTGPYDINAFAVVAGIAALKDPDYIRRYVAEVSHAKQWVIDQLTKLSIKHYGQGGNFLLVWPPADCDAIEGSLRTKGILVRNMRGKPIIQGSFRLTIGTLAQMQAFMDSFLEVIHRSGR